jgi:hypothetical protein
MQLLRTVMAGSVLCLLNCGKSNKDSAATPTPSAGSGSAASGTIAAKPAPVVPAKPAGPLQPLADDSAPASGKPLWARAVGGMSTELPRDIAIADDNSAVMVGYFQGDSDVAFRSGNNDKPDHRISLGDSDAFVTKFDTAEKPAWTLTFGGKNGDSAAAVAIRNKQMLVVGNFSDKIALALPGVPIEKAPSATAFGADDIFAALINEQGETQWLFTAGGVDSDGANTVAATPDGGWIIGGSFADKITIGTTTLISAGRTDALMIKLDGDGAVQWVKQFGGLYEDSIIHLAVDVQGNVIVQGVFADEVTWGGEKMHAGGGSDADVVLAKYDGNGNHQWSKHFGSQFNEVAGGVAVDPAGNILMTGSYDRSIGFGDGDHGCAGESDVFVAKFGPDGSVQWSKTFGGAREDIGFGIAVDAAGSATVTGWFFSKMEIAGKSVTGKGNKDIFVAKFDAKGALRWVSAYGDLGHDQGRAIALDKSGAAVVAGVFRFALNITSPVLNSVRADGDKSPKPDAFIAGFER